MSVVLLVCGALTIIVGWLANVAYHRSLRRYSAALDEYKIALDEHSAALDEHWVTLAELIRIPDLCAEPRQPTGPNPGLPERRPRA